MKCDSSAGSRLAWIPRSHARLLLVLREDHCGATLVAIASNLAFIGYALAKGLYPVLILHVVLLPLNCVRLAQLRAVTKRPDPETRNPATIASPENRIPPVSDMALLGGPDAERKVKVGQRDGPSRNFVALVGQLLISWLIGVEK